jgi:hypothetical protein
MLWAFSHVSICELSLQPGVKAPLTLGTTVHNYGEYRGVYTIGILPSPCIVRPEFTGTLAIKGGRHPVLEHLQAAGTYVPNDTYANDSSTFQMVYGPKYVIKC